MNLLKKLLKRKTNSTNHLSALERYTEKVVEVYYISHGEAEIEKGILKYPNERFFYLADEEGYNIIYWNGPLNAVGLIKDSDGTELYRNNEIMKQFSKIQRKESKKLEEKVSKTKTRSLQRASF